MTRLGPEVLAAALGLATGWTVQSLAIVAARYAGTTLDPDVAYAIGIVVALAVAFWQGTKERVARMDEGDGWFILVAAALGVGARTYPSPLPTSVAAVQAFVLALAVHAVRKAGTEGKDRVRAFVEAGGAGPMQGPET